MAERIQIDKVDPRAYDALFALEDYLADSGLDEFHLALIKIRASQLNGCSFCVQLYSQEACLGSIAESRVSQLENWEEQGIFSEEERLVLELTQKVTLIHQEGLGDALYDSAMKKFGSAYLLKLIMAISTINLWNRIILSTDKSE